MRRIALSAVLFFFLTGPAFAALTFPALTGRVVDDAHVLSPQTVQSLEATLANFENITTDQVVVVTLPSLQETSIEDYGYQLGRLWGIGQKGKDNGVLLIVAPVEKKVRIEVGYGLEGTLTDAASSGIIQGVILPDFKAGHLDQGVKDGTLAILDTLNGKQAPATAAPMLHHIPPMQWLWIALVVLMLIGKFVLLCDPRFYKDHPFLAMFLLFSGSSSSSGSGGSGFGGGFSGGGGGFGGGGASGGW